MLYICSEIILSRIPAVKYPLVQYLYTRCISSSASPHHYFFFFAGAVGSGVDSFIEADISGAYDEIKSA